MGRYSNHEQENLSKENEFLSFARKYKKQLLDTGLDSLKTAFKKVVHKTGEFLRNKFADVITNSYNGKNCKSKTYLRNNYSTRKKRRNIQQIRASITKMEHYKISILLNDSTVSKFATKKLIEVNDLSSSQYSVNKKIRFKI